MSASIPQETPERKIQLPSKFSASQMIEGIKKAGCTGIFAPKKTKQGVTGKLRGHQVSLRPPSSPSVQPLQTPRPSPEAVKTPCQETSKPSPVPCTHSHSRSSPYVRDQKPKGPVKTVAQLLNETQDLLNQGKTVLNERMAQLNAFRQEGKTMQEALSAVLTSPNENKK